MKNISLYLNVVLLVAVGILFWLHFSSRPASAPDKPVTKKGGDSAAAKLSFSLPAKMKAAHVLYVNIDSMNQRYQALVDLQKQSDATILSYQTQYAQKEQAYQTKYTDAMQKAQRGEMSEVDQNKVKLELDALEKEAAQIQKNMEFAQRDALNKNAQIVKDVTLYFKDFSREKGVDYILGYGAGETVLYANDSLDVTDEVIKALNEQYGKNKPAAKK